MKEILKTVENYTKTRHARSAWSKGVNAYALDLASKLQEALDDGYITAEELNDRKAIEKILLNGAESWSQYSWGGSALIYDYDIAERLCCPSELRKTRNGERRPNAREEWPDVQARALYQAARIIKNALAPVFKLEVAQ